MNENKLADNDKQPTSNSQSKTSQYMPFLFLNKSNRVLLNIIFITKIQYYLIINLN